MEEDESCLKNVWTLLRDSVNQGYDNNCKETLKKVISLINSSCKAKTKWYIPTIVGAEIPEDSCTLQEQEHTAFCTWLLGHLFCIYEKEEMLEIHSSCTNAQIEVFVACSQNRYMNQFFFNEYLCCLKDLMEIQSSKSLLTTGPQLLKRFTPLPVTSLEEMNLVPKYVLVDSESLLKNLLNYVTEILESAVQYIAHVCEDLILEMLTVFCNLISKSSVSIQMRICRVFSQVISVVGCYEENILLKLCNGLKSMMQALPTHFSVEKSFGRLQDLSFEVGNLLNTIITSRSFVEAEMREDLLIVLRSLLLAWEFQRISGPAVQTACQNVASLLHNMNPGSVDLNSYLFLLRTVPTQEHSIPIFEQVMFSELVHFIKSSQDLKPNSLAQKIHGKSPCNDREELQVCASSLQTWNVLHNLLWDDMTSALNCVSESPTKQSFEQLKNMVGKVHVIVCCAVSLDACALPCKELNFITLNFFGKKSRELLGQLRSLLLTLSSLNTSFEGLDDILKLIFTTVCNLMLLPEMINCSIDDAQFAISLVSLPWIKNNDVLDLKVDKGVLVFKNNFQQIQENINGETLKSISLKFLANVPKSLYPKWRMSLFNIALSESLKSKSHETRFLAERALEVIPCLLMDVSQQPSDILHHLLIPIINSGNDHLVIALSQVFSTVVCVLAGNFVPVSVKSPLNIVIRSIICRTCHKRFCGNKFKAANTLDSFKTELLEFMALLTSPISAVRCNMASSLGSLVFHLPVMYEPDILLKWMKYAQDQDDKVRTIFSMKATFLIFQRDWMQEKEIESKNLKEEHIPLTQVDRAELSHSRPRLKRVLEVLFGYINANLSGNNQDFALHSSVLETIVNIGRVPLDCVLLPVIKIVLMCVSHPAFAHPAIAQVYLKQIADAHNTHVCKLYHRFQSEICKVLVQLAGMNFHVRPSWTKYMDKVVYAMGFKSTVVWLRQSFSCIAPIVFVLVVKLDDSAFLDEIASLLDLDKLFIVRSHFQHIFPYVYLNESDNIVHNCVALMEQLSGLTYEKLLISSFKNVHSEFLLHYPSKKKRVEDGIRKLITVLENHEGNKSGKLLHSTPDIAEHLDKRFLGVLNHFDGLFDSSNIEEALKIKALQSLPEIIRLLGPKYITPVRFKVLSTLRTALRLTHCDFPHLSCSAWESFIKSVELQALGPLLGTIVAALLPLLDQYPEETSSMLQWLVMQHESQLSEYIPDLFFLPDHPAIKDVYIVVQRHMKRVENAFNESLNLEDYLQQPLRFVSHDNVDMRKYGLQHLLTLLKSKQEKIINELLSKDIVHPDVAKLLNLLVEGCRDPDHDVRLLCVQNLGMLGALDPGHLPLKRSGTGQPYIMSVEEEQFCVQALIVLSKGYHAARNTRNLDRFAVAIQELMKHYQISKRKLWNQFPESVQQIMAPFESSSYYIQTQPNTVWPHPVFGTRYASSLTKWAHTWACRIVTFLDVNSFAKIIFTVCIPNLMTDVSCVMFFLPFILLYGVIYGNDDQHKMITEEILLIIQQRKKKEEGGESHLNIITEKLQIGTHRFVVSSEADDSDRATNALCAKTVFSLLEFLEKWVIRSRKNRDNFDIDRFVPLEHRESIDRVRKFLTPFRKLDLAHGNYGVMEYVQALMYLEDFLMGELESGKSHWYSEGFLLSKQEIIKDHLGFLGRIYAQINEPDGIKGVLAIQCIQPKLIESVVYHEVTGQYQEALACYELLDDNNADISSLHMQLGMVRCCLNLDQPYAAMLIAEGVMSKRPDHFSPFLEAQAECFWRINRFDDLDKVLSNPKLEDSTAWGVSIGRCLIDIFHQNDEKLTEHLRLTWNSLSKALSTASLEQGGYCQGYLHVVKLHMLEDIQSASKVFSSLRSEENENSCTVAVQHLAEMWKNRSALLQAIPSVLEQVLRLHRSLLQLATIFVRKDHKCLAQLLKKEIGCSWLKSAEVARLAECSQQAYGYLLHAEKYKPKQHFILLAKLHWQKNVQDSALSTLRRGLQEHFPKGQSNSKLDTEDLKIYAEAKLLIAMYNDLSSNVDCDVSVENYKEAIQVYGKWEKSHAHLAHYYDRMTLNPNDRSIRTADFLMWSVTNYLKSLRYGCCRVYHTMSRLLTLWLEFGKRCQRDEFAGGDSLPSKENLTERKERLTQINQTIDGYLNVLPPYMFMVGFSQLVSRICHPMKEVYAVIRGIIAKLLASYPQQTMWMLLASFRSSYPLRLNRCQAVLDEPIVKNSPHLVRLAADFRRLGGLLVELCQKHLPQNTHKASVQALVKDLPKLLTSKSFSKIIVPLLNSRTLTLPKLNNSSLDTHSPFSQKTPFIIGICDEVTVLHSLQKPRKITLRGSDGNLYEIMCKDKDDLRLDARVMEFSSIVNNYLQKDPASCSRNLSIRTYSVVPLSELNGLIEWVPNLIGYRLINFQIMKEFGYFIQPRELRKYQLDKTVSFSEKKRVFLKHLIPLHPPVFRRWFRNNFTDSRSWFDARKSYIHTCAVMSMVGYILGLGDRHGENILMDTTCGDVVHVDFNCLFNRGETFDWPERVPFRLTHNMVSAMGPTGVEGPFRHVSEVTLKVLRENKETLSSVLEPFMYDPLVTWSKSKKDVPDAQGEMMNNQAVEHVKNIDLRLNGVLISGEKKCNVHLSVEGQVAYLIQEATNTDNLCQMYFGWAAYM